jgi:hypothetical protein
MSNTAWVAVTAIATGATALVAVAAAIFALRQLSDARKVRIDEARPYIVVDFEDSPATPVIIDFVIKNLGRTAAYDVEMVWDPKPVESLAGRDDEFANVRMFREPILMIAPGRELRIFFDSRMERTPDKGLPSLYTLTVRYAASKDLGKLSFTEEFKLDLDSREGGTYVEALGIHHAAKALQDLTKAFKSSALSNRNQVDIRSHRERAAYFQEQRREMAHRDALLAGRTPPPRRPKRR